MTAIQLRFQMGCVGNKYNVRSSGAVDDNGDTAAICLTDTGWEAHTDAPLMMDEAAQSGPTFYVWLLDHGRAYPLQSTTIEDAKAEIVALITLNAFGEKHEETGW